VKRLTITRRAAALAAVAAFAVIVMTGCTTKLTGGGFMPSSAFTPAGDNNGKANFGFVYNAEKLTSDGLAKFNGTYHDGDVLFKFDDAIPIPTTGPDGCTVPALVHYVSQNPAFPGDGFLIFFGCDNGEPGPSNGDFLTIIVVSGPYTGYTNVGATSGGNLQAH
jgi:hypothetical protein